MKIVTMPEEKRDCPHCKANCSLHYYRENSIIPMDMYYCNQCYGIALWNGKSVMKGVGEAYPSRERIRCG